MVTMKRLYNSLLSSADTRYKEVIFKRGDKVLKVMQVRMEKILISVLMMCVLARADPVPDLESYPKYQEGPRSEVGPNVICTPSVQIEQNNPTERYSCGTPHEKFVPLYPKSADETLRPQSVWIKQCMGGVCEGKAQCKPTEIVTRNFTVLVQNVKTNKEYCTSYKVEEHIKCVCGCSSHDRECPDSAQRDVIPIHWT